MSPVEAIEAEIEREVRELEELAKQERELQERMRKSFQENPKGPPDFELFREAIALLERLLRGDEHKQEIEGKRRALAAVKAGGANVLGAIDAEIETEMVRAHDLGSRAQRLREQALRDEQAGNKEEARRKREEAKRLSDEAIMELARLRGKHTARREVQQALKAGKSKSKKAKKSSKKKQTKVKRSSARTGK